MGLDQVVDRIRQLAAAPVLEAVDLAFGPFDQGLVALDHGRHLFTLVRMDQEHDLVVTHVVSSWISAAGGTPLAGTAPGRSWRTPWGKGLPADREPDIIAGGATAAQVVVLPGRGGAPHAAPWRAAGGQATLSASVVKLSPQPQAAAALGLL